MGLVNKQYKDLIGDAYKNYQILTLKSLRIQENEIKEKGGWQHLCLEPNILSQEEFINKIKTDNEFAKRWDITIETKELTEDERINLLHIKHGNKGHHIEAGFNMLDEFDIPTKLITIIYNNETIENYE
jgi:hypothetical protein